MRVLEEISIQEKEVGYCLVPSKFINETDIVNTEDYEIGVYIPKLMSEIEMGTKPETVETFGMNSDMIINRNFPITFSNKIKTSNFIRVKPYKDSNRSVPIIAPGEKMYINFLNNNINTPYYTREMNEEYKRERDIHSITCNTMDNGKVKTYKLTLNGIDNNVILELSDDLFLKFDDKKKEVTITAKDTSISMVNGKIDIKGDFTINGKTIQEIVTEIHNSLGSDNSAD